MRLTVNRRTGKTKPSSVKRFGRALEKSSRLTSDLQALLVFYQHPT